MNREEAEQVTIVSISGYAITFEPAHKYFPLCGTTGWTTTPPWQEWPPTAITKVPPAALGRRVSFY